MIALLIGTVLGLAEGSDALNTKVVAFARSKLGQTVGDGDCAALAAEALRAAGARRRGRSWGEERASLKDAQAGDILQFEDAVFVRRRVREDGAVVTLTFRSPHHTAIVSGVRKRGRRVVLTVIQQNVGFEGEAEATAKVVRESLIDPAEMTRGSLRAYRPAADPPADPRRRPAAAPGPPPAAAGG